MDFRVSIPRFIKDLFSSNGTEPSDLLSPHERALDKLEERFGLSEVWDRGELNKNENWISAQGGNTFSVDLSESWSLLDYWYHFRGPVKNVTNNVVMLLGCPTPTFKSDTDNAAWRAIADANGFPGRWKRIIKAAVLWNDFITVIFHGQQIRDDLPVKVKIRNLEPWKIRKIETEEGDPETITKFVRADGKDPYLPEKAVHHVLDKIGNRVRGIPQFNAVLRPLHYAYKLLENIHWIYHLRARFPAVRKVRGNLARLNTEKNRLNYLPAPGHVAIENFGNEWVFPKIEGPQGAKEAWELHMMSIASAWNLPVFLVTSDFSNHALASTLAADSPTIRMIQSYRDILDPQFREIVRKALGHPCEVTFKWPPIVEHDPKMLAERYEVELRNGLVSKETASSELGHDWKHEYRLIQAENRLAIEIARQNQPEPDDEDEEE